MYALLGAFASVAAQLGDLSASYIKRVCEIKDFGSIPTNYQMPVAYCYAKGLLTGDENSNFNGSATTTRAQAAAMIGRTQEKGYAIVDLTFSDTASIPAYATYYIQTMVAQGVLSGYADGTFKPQANITRGQMAKILYTLM